MSKSYEIIIQENEYKKLNKYLAEQQEEESLCDSCENDCYDESMIVDACSRYIKKAKNGIFGIIGIHKKGVVKI